MGGAMADDPKKDDEKRDEVLKRMLGTKPEQKPGSKLPRPRSDKNA
jgi:hypothetical protein